MRTVPGDPARDARVAGLLIAWFEQSARVLPWRSDLSTAGAARDPYVCLVAEAMLQQTQVSRVVVYLERFLARFASVRALAAADEADVLALWSGLGYYRRARNLHAAARMIVERFGGAVPSTVEELRDLPGVGAYTAAAIASIVFRERAALVDGNVQRVLQRLDGHAGEGKHAAAWAWGRAAELVAAADGGEKSVRYARLNEGLMELGALVCVPPPAAARCGACPLAGECVARAKGLVGEIPKAKATTATKAVVCLVVVVVDPRGRVLVEQRPEAGMWSNMWQAPTLEGGKRATSAAAAAFAAMKGADAGSLVRAGAFVHQTTHRTLEFVVLVARAGTCARKNAAGRRWVSKEELSGLGLSSAAKRAIEMGRAKFA